MLKREDIRPEIIAQGCEKCSGAIGDAGDFVLTFYRGRFIVLHNDCSDFIDHANRGPRGNLSGALSAETLERLKRT